MKKIVYFIFVVFIGLSLCSGCGSKAAPAISKSPLISDSMLQLLTIDTARIRPFDGAVTLSGKVSFDDNKIVKVYPFSSGQVQSVPVSLGDYVHKGQVLATIKSADIAGAYADLSTAGADMAIAKKASDNVRHLFETGIASEREATEAKENFRKAATTVSKLRAQIQINGGGHTASNGSYTLTSPRNGYVVEKLINTGAFIRSDNMNNLFTIGDIGDVWIWANVYETDLAKVKEGYAAQVTTLAYPDKVFNGRVNKVSEVLDPSTKVMKVRIVLPNSDGTLKPEMFANITVSNHEGEKALAVPSSSIISEDGKNFVVIYRNQNDVQTKEVNIAKIAGPITFLSSGVKDGERIITKNQVLVYQKLKEMNNE